MSDELVIRAAHNNAEWCDAVCRAHNAPGEFSDHLWLNRHETPPFYPNIVTLTPNAAETQTERIREFSKHFASGFAVKDSFATLDLVPLGFEILFSAEWLSRPPSLPAPEGHLGGVAWRKIDSEVDLVAWEAAWNAGHDQPVHVFEPSLLKNSDIGFFAAYNNQRIVAGGIANQTGDVVGISNIFTPKDAEQDFWASFVRLVAETFPGLALVGYERGAELKIAHSINFQSIGPLRVWAKTTR